MGSATLYGVQKLAGHNNSPPYAHRGSFFPVCDVLLSERCSHNDPEPVTSEPCRLSQLIFSCLGLSCDTSRTDRDQAVSPHTQEDRCVHITSLFFFTVATHPAPRGTGLFCVLPDTRSYQKHAPLLHRLPVLSPSMLPSCFGSAPVIITQRCAHGRLSCEIRFSCSLISSSIAYSAEIQVSCF